MTHKVQECLQFEHKVVVKFPSFYVSFRKLVRFVVSLILYICSWRVPWLCACGRNARNVAKYRSSEKRRLANVTKEKAPQ